MGLFRIFCQKIRPKIHPRIRGRIHAKRRESCLAPKRRKSFESNDSPSQDSAPPVAVFIEGGLGNQLFHYAFALVLSRHLPRREVLLDASFYKRQRGANARNFELDNFCVRLKIVRTKREICALTNTNYAHFLFKFFLNRVVNKFARLFGFAPLNLALLNPAATIVAPHLSYKNIADLARSLTGGGRTIMMNARLG